MAKNLFGNLIKISGNNWESYKHYQLSNSGNLIFADIVDTSNDGEHTGKYIWANGVEYQVADASEFDALVQRVDTLDSSVLALEVSVGNLLHNATLLASADNNMATVTLEVSTDNGTDSSTKFTVSGDTSYIKVAEGEEENALELSANIVHMANASSDNTGLADSWDVKHYVDDQISVLEQALVFKSNITDTADASAKLTDVSTEAGWTYVVVDSGDGFDYNGNHLENGDLVIVKEDSDPNEISEIIVVERNLDGAVTSGDVLTAGNLVIGNNAQDVKDSGVSLADVSVAMANANSALQDVNAATEQDTYVQISIEANGENASTLDVSAVVKIIDVSNAQAKGDGLADAYDVQQYVDTKTTGVKVNYSLDSSTPDYVLVSSEVDNTGRTISASVGVVTATLADASNGSVGLAMAKDVYDELTKVEYVMATAVTNMSAAVGLDPSFGVSWSQESGIVANSSIVSAVEQVARLSKNDIIDLSTYVHGTVDASVNNLEERMDVADASINALEQWKIDTSFVNTVEGEEVISDASTSLVYVNANPTDGDVKLTSGVVLATDVDLIALSDHYAISGLATDGYVKDYVEEKLSWEVIE